jgi:hypothetical protein
LDWHCVDIGLSLIETMTVALGIASRRMSIVQLQKSMKAARDMGHIGVFKFGRM